MPTETPDRYTIISADTHAGGSHREYREYLDPEWRDEFDAWREKYKNPWKDLAQHRSARPQLGRRAARRRPAGRRRRRRGALPQHRAALLPGLHPLRRAAQGGGLRPPPGRPPGPQPLDGRLLRPPARAAGRHRPDLPERHRPRDRGRHLDQGARPAGRRAAPDDRAGREVGAAALRPRVRPALGRVPGPRHPGAPARRHGLARLRPLRGGADDHDRRGALLRHAQLRAHAARRRVRALPPAEVRHHRGRRLAVRRRCSKQLDGIIASVREGSIGELKYAEDTALPRSATEYFQQNVWLGASFPGPADVEARTVLGEDRFMWGSDYPHDEGTGPFTREHLRQVMHDLPEDELRKILGENAAKLYGFDLDALAPLAAQYGPTVEEVRQPARRAAGEPEQRAAASLGQASSPERRTSGCSVTEQVGALAAIGRDPDVGAAARTPSQLGTARPDHPGRHRAARAARVRAHPESATSPRRRRSRWPRSTATSRRRSSSTPRCSWPGASRSTPGCGSRAARRRPMPTGCGRRCGRRCAAYERHPNFFRLVDALEVVTDPAVSERFMQFASRFTDCAGRHARRHRRGGQGDRSRS